MIIIICNCYFIFKSLSSTPNALSLCSLVQREFSPLISNIWFLRLRPCRYRSSWSSPAPSWWGTTSSYYPESWIPLSPFGWVYIVFVLWVADLSFIEEGCLWDLLVLVCFCFLFLFWFSFLQEILMHATDSRWKSRSVAFLVSMCPISPLSFFFLI